MMSSSTRYGALPGSFLLVFMTPAIFLSLCSPSGLPLAMMYEIFQFWCSILNYYRPRRPANYTGEPIKSRRSAKARLFWPDGIAVRPASTAACQQHLKTLSRGRGAKVWLATHRTSCASRTVGRHSGGLIWMSQVVGAPDLPHDRKTEPQAVISCSSSLEKASDPSGR
jgi:hypothetical protein